MMKRYGGITRNELDLLRAELRQQGVDAPAGDDVTLEGPHGVQLRAQYDAGRATLSLSIVHKPFWMPASRIWELIDEAVGHFAG